MTSPIHIDANIPIYGMGREHPLREPSLAVLLLAAEHPSAFFTDAEVLQEIVHRHMALRRWPEAYPYFQQFVVLMSGRIEPMLASDVQDTALFATRYEHLTARDLVHVAIMQRVGARRIVSADTGFERLEGIERLDPMKVDEWRETVTA
jgi:predicted nucleic acid-binding protein